MYFGNNKQVFAFKYRRHVEYVKNHIKYEGNNLDELVQNTYLLKTHYNKSNIFITKPIRDESHINIIEKRLYSIMISCNINNVYIGIVDNVRDRENGDLELIVNDVTNKMPLNNEVVKFNLEMMLKK